MQGWIFKNLHWEWQIHIKSYLFVFYWWQSAVFRARVIVSLCTDMRVARAIFQQLMTQGNMSTFYHWRQIRLLQGKSCARCVKLGFTFPYWNTSENLVYVNFRRNFATCGNVDQIVVPRGPISHVVALNFCSFFSRFNLIDWSSLWRSFLDLILLIEALSGESFLNWKYCKRTVRKVYAQP